MPLSWKEGNVLFNDALQHIVIWLYGIGHMVKNHSDSERGNLLPHHYMGYSFRVTARSRLYAPSHTQDRTCHGLCYTSIRTLAGMRISSMGPP